MFVDLVLGEGLVEAGRHVHLQQKKATEVVKTGIRASVELLLGSLATKRELERSLNGQKY